MSKQVRNCLLILLSLVLLSWSGCTSSAPPETDSSVIETPPPPGVASSPIEVTDQLGRVVRLEKTPQRIASLDPGNTEILFALGLGDKLVAVTDDCDHPPEAKTKPSVGNYYRPDIEKLAGLSPDLVFVTSAHQDEIIPQLEQGGMTVFALAPNNLDDILAGITLAGEITRQQDEASQLIAGMRERIEVVTSKTNEIPDIEKPRVIYVIWYFPLITAGSGTMENDLIQKAGGINIAQDIIGYDEMSLETVIEANPEVMIVGFDLSAYGNAPYEQIIEEWQLAETDAIRNERIFPMWNVLLQRYGPRLVNGLEELTMLIYLDPSK